MSLESNAKKFISTSYWHNKRIKTQFWKRNVGYIYMYIHIYVYIVHTYIGDHDCLIIEVSLWYLSKHIQLILIKLNFVGQLKIKLNNKKNVYISSICWKFLYWVRKLRCSQEVLLLRSMERLCSKLTSAYEIQLQSWRTAF